MYLPDAGVLRRRGGHARRRTRLIPLSSATQPTLEVQGTTYRLAVLHGPEMALLVPLFRREFGRGFFTPEWLERKYACEYGDVRGFSCVALTEQGDAAASFGVLPWAVRLGDRVEVAAQMVDAATAGEHRRRGLFTHLAEMARKECEAAGISFLFAFPHVEGGSYPGFIRNLGYRHIDDLVEYRLPIRTWRIERVARRIGTLRSLYDGHTRRTLSAYAPADSVLENSLFADGFAGIDRDRCFHAYKSAFGDSRVVDLGCGRAWLKVGHGLLLGDLEARSDTDMHRTARALTRLAARLGVHQILFQASRDTRFSSLSADGFESGPGLAVVYRNLSSRIPSEKLRFTFGDLDNF